MVTLRNRYAIAYGNDDAGLVDYYPDCFETQREAALTADFWLETNWDREDIEWAEVRNLDKPDARPKRFRKTAGRQPTGGRG